MTMKEASYLIKKNEDDFIDSWQKVRQISYSIFQSQSTTRLELTDIFKFPWEEKEAGVELKTRSKEELIKYALEMEKIINKNG